MIPSLEYPAKEIQRSHAQKIFDLVAKGANTKGKNKSDLVFLCPQYQVPTSMVEKIHLA